MKFVPSVVSWVTYSAVTRVLGSTTFVVRVSDCCCCWVVVVLFVVVVVVFVFVCVLM